MKIETKKLRWSEPGKDERLYKFLRGKANGKDF